MKVLIVSTSEQQGGAAIAAKRLMIALNERGHEARMLVRDKQTDDERVHTIRSGKWRKLWEHFLVVALNHFDTEGTWKLSLGCTGVDITSHEDFLWADVIHLHWVHQGFLSIADIRAIIRTGKRCVWTMHDQWAFTGVCHLVNGCWQFYHGCRFDCPQMKGRTHRRIYLEKKDMFRQGNITLVGCSKWICELAEMSPNTHHQRLTCIPNLLSLDIFKPIPKDEARKALGLPTDMNYVMVCAAKFSDKLKGFDDIQKAVRFLDTRENVAIIVVGRGSKLKASVPIYYYPYVESQEKMALLYAAASVFVSASLTENLPNTIAEAMCCGTACCAYKVGGIPQMIIHGWDGVLVEPQDFVGLLMGIRRVIDSTMYMPAASEAREIYNYDYVLRRYLNVYKWEDPWDCPDDIPKGFSILNTPGRKWPILKREQRYGKRHIERQHPMPWFTVCTVCRNAQATLPATLRSVADQNYPLIEHLIIDACSTDGTLQLLQTYEAENLNQYTPHKIRIISEPDKGLYDAMNKGIREATGRYIIFLNAGDRFHEDGQILRVARQVGLFPEELPAVIYGETDLVDTDGNFIRHRRLRAPRDLNWKHFSSGMLVCHQSFYVRTDIARQENYLLQYRFSSDFDWCIRIMKRCAAQFRVLHNTHLVLTDYLSDGLTTKNHRRSLLERFQIMTTHYGYPRTILMHLWFLIRAIVVR